MPMPQAAPPTIPPHLALSEVAIRVLEELAENDGQLTERELQTKIRASTFALEHALRQLHQQYLCAWGHDQYVGAVYRILTYGRMRLGTERELERRRHAK